MTETVLGWWGVPLGVLAGAIRSSTPFLFVSLGELLTEKSGRINLGQEGILVLGAMCGYGIAFLTGSPWLGVLVAGCAGAVLEGGPDHFRVRCRASHHMHCQQG